MYVVSPLHMDHALESTHIIRRNMWACTNIHRSLKPQLRKYILGTQAIDNMHSDQYTYML